MNNIYDMYIMLCLNSWFPLFLFKLTHERAKSLRQINSLDAEMYCLNSHKGRHARPRHGRVNVLVPTMDELMPIRMKL